MALFWNIIIGLLYVTGFSLLFSWINRRKSRPIGTQWVVTAFVVKAVAGMAYGYMYAHFFESSDSWLYFRESLTESHNLLTQPLAFLQSGLHLNHADDIFSTADGASWSNTGENLLIKLLAVLNIFSGGNYYINAVIYNAFSFYGLYLLFLVTKANMPQRPLLLFAIIFFLPSCLFWNSGIDKDGLILFFTGGLLYVIDNSIRKGVNGKRIAVALISLIFIFLIRNVNAMLLIPAIIAWWLAARVTQKPRQTFVAVYGICIIFFFLTLFLPPQFNLPLRLAEKQHQFLALQANTVLPLTPLQPSVGSYLTVLPEAANHAFLRPYITELKSPFHFMAFLEALLILIFVVLSVKSGWKTALRKLTEPYNLVLLLVALSGMLLIGYTVPFPGAIVRYKALYSVLFLLPFAAILKFGENRLKK